MFSMFFSDVACRDSLALYNERIESGGFESEVCIKLGFLSFNLLHFILFPWKIQLEGISVVLLRFKESLNV